MPPSHLLRLGSAITSAARELRGIPPPSAALTGEYGVPALFMGESLKAYGDNVYLYRAVLSIAIEIARVPLRLVRGEGESQKSVDAHDALEALRVPQPIVGGKSILSSRDLKLITIMHLLLEVGGFWNLDARKRVNGSPTQISPLLPECMQLRLDRQKNLAEYIYRLPDREILRDPMDVVHFKLPDPANWLRGHAPTHAVRRG